MHMNIINKIRQKIIAVKKNRLKNKFGYCGKNVNIGFTEIISPQNLYLHDNTNIFEGFLFLSAGGSFTMKEGSGAAQNLTVVTGNHGRCVGRRFKDKEMFVERKAETSTDIVVEEDVWIGANVTLLPGANVGRSATIGANSVVRGSVPPYAVVAGNPGKVVGFNFTPEEIIEHEKALYPEEQRLSIEFLEKNYKKYFLDHIKEIKADTSLICK